MNATTDNSGWQNQGRATNRSTADLEREGELDASSAQDAFDRLKGVEGTYQHSARVAGTNEGIGLACSQQVKAYRYGRLLLFAQGFGGVLVHIDHLRGMHDFVLLLR